jgi:phosphate transport system substrate-binding protein
MLKKIISIAASAAVVASVLLATPAHAAESIVGQGSSFAGNALTECTARYTKNTATYTGNSSGTGRSAFTGGTNDYALTDAVYTSGFPTGTYNTIPLFGGPITFVYTAAGVGDGLNLTAQNASDIMKGIITMWNDSRIKANNLKIKLPKKTIKVFYRSGSSGTSENLSEYFSEVLPSAGWTKNGTWATATGDATPIGTPAASSGALKLAVEDSVNGFGYLDLSDAIAADVGIAKLKNQAGAFVAPTSSSGGKFLNAQLAQSTASDATNGTVNLDFTKVISGAYQASLLVYGIAPRFVPTSTVKVSTNAKKIAVRDFFTYIVGTCLPSKAATLGYVALGGALKTAVSNKIKTIG